MDFRLKKVIFIVGIVLFLLGADVAKAASVGDIVNFNLDKGFDAGGRTQTPSTLVKITDKLYFFKHSSVRSLYLPYEDSGPL